MANNGMTLTSYNPSLRDRVAWFFGDMFPQNRTMRNWAQNSAREATDWVPGLSEAAATDETLRSVYEKDWKGAAIGAGGLAASMVPGASKAWRKMFHGTKSPTAFNEFRLSDKDVGIHASPDIGVANRYAGINPELAPEDAVGGSIMPVLVDPRRNYNARGAIPDPVNWLDNPSIIQGIEDAHMGVPPELKSIVDELHRGDRFDDVLKRRNFDSMSYDHFPEPYSDPAEAMMVLSPDQITPAMSPKGLTLNSKRRRITGRMDPGDIKWYQEWFSDN